MASSSSTASDLAALFNKQLELGDPAAPLVQRIADSASLDARLSGLCASVFEALTSRQCEATYQRCLALDLEEAGVEVFSEVSMHLTYKGQRVGTRRADLVLRTRGDGELAVCELKAVAELSSDHLKQLEFYMHCMNIDVGYLINFPHDAGFPSVLDGGAAGMASSVGSSGSGGQVAAPVFKQVVLLGAPQPLSDRATRGKHADSSVQVVKVVRVRPSANDASLPHASVAGAHATDAAARAPPHVPPSAPGGGGGSTGSPASIRPTPAAPGMFGITQKGTPCKVCIKQGGFCSMHTYQRK